MKAMPVDSYYSVESDVHTLAEARKIEADPKRFRAARALARKKMTELEEVAEGGKADNEKAEGE